VRNLISINTASGASSLTPDYDSGWVPTIPEGLLVLTHDLNTLDVLIYWERDLTLEPGMEEYGIAPQGFICGLIPLNLTTTQITFGDIAAASAPVRVKMWKVP
jgi:hypothetical protein